MFLKVPSDKRVYRRVSSTYNSYNEMVTTRMQYRLSVKPRANEKPKRTMAVYENRKVSVGEYMMITDDNRLDTTVQGKTEFRS